MLTRARQVAGRRPQLQMLREARAPSCACDGLRHPISRGSRRICPHRFRISALAYETVSATLATRTRATRSASEPGCVLDCPRTVLPLILEIDAASRAPMGVRRARLRRPESYQFLRVRLPATARPVRAVQTAERLSTPLKKLGSSKLKSQRPDASASGPAEFTGPSRVSLPNEPKGDASPMPVLTDGRRRAKTASPASAY